MDFRVCWLVTNMNIHPINTKTFHTCLYFVSTLVHLWKKWLLKSTAIVKSLYCKETPESKVNLLQTWNIFMLEPYNLILENTVFSSQYKTLEKYYNYKYLQMVPDLWGLKLVILNTTMERKWEEYTAQVPTFSLPRLSSNSELQAAAMCSWATAYALRCTAASHCSAGWRVQCISSIWNFMLTRCLLQHNPIVYRGSSHKRHFTAQWGTLSTPENANTLTSKGAILSKSHALL